MCMTRQKLRFVAVYYRHDICPARIASSWEFAESQTKGSTLLTRRASLPADLRQYRNGIFKLKIIVLCFLTIIPHFEAFTVKR
jgi:hypothetical protein